MERGSILKASRHLKDDAPPIHQRLFAERKVRDERRKQLEDSAVPVQARRRSDGNIHQRLYEEHTEKFQQMVRGRRPSRQDELLLRQIDAAAPLSSAPASEGSNSELDRIFIELSNLS